VTICVMHIKKERQDETQFTTKIDGFSAYEQTMWYEQGQNWQIQNQCISDRGGSCITSSLQGVSIVNPSRLLQQNLAAFHHF
jgi:hypothetical protein